MPIDLNHTIVAAHDKHTAAAWLADILGLQVGEQYGPFVPVETSNGVALDFLDSDSDQITPQHYAFLVSENEFDAILARIQQAGITHWAGPEHQHPGQINHNDGGRGTYFDDPNGHILEILTQPYGSSE